MLAERLLQVVQNQPEAIAIDDLTGSVISYAELLSRVRSAGAEITRLFGDEKYVGIVADQDSRAAIVCIAAILSGKTIIPIDPRHDAGLIEQMLNPFTDKIVCGVEKDLSATFTVIPLGEIALDKEAEFIFESEDSDAYILHTSGTTGKPKPVLARQSALLQVAEALAERYHITSASKVLQFAYLSFDSSLIETWSTLFGGGRIVIPGKKLRDDLYGCLDELLEKRQITTATLPSSVADSVRDEYLYNFKTLILAGDECPTELANRLCGHIPHLINAYGPTESIICATTYEVHEPLTSRVPIGLPLPGMEIVIDDPDGDGRGEMILVSSYLAKGYANDDEQTSRKFGFDNIGRRYYKSGDVGRLQNDGNYEFLGRVDHQVKINGQRIELEGLEALIRNVTKRNDVAVVAVSNKLYCYYRSNERLPEFEDIARHLNGKLPSHVMPRVFVPIREMPLDLNGKINRKALIAHIADPDPTTVSHSIQEQLSDDEGAEMISLWAAPLSVAREEIDGNATFFSLGGDSLSALKLLKAINDKYEANLRLSDIIADPATPASMLEAVKKQRLGV